MRRPLLPLLVGFVLGVPSWLVIPLVSNKLGLFDSDEGLYIGQALMSILAFYFGFSRGVGSVLAFVAGAYISLNLYSYLFGTSEVRAWALLGLFATSLLCVCPLGIGLLGKVAKLGKVKYQNRLKNDA